MRGHIQRRNLVGPVGRGCGSHLFLDPDIGLWHGPGAPAGGWDKHVSVAEFAGVARAPGRQHRMTMVYDQSFSYTLSFEQRRHRASEKLQALREHHRLPAVAYVSHVVFIWASPDPILLTRATNGLRDDSLLPRWRFIDNGAGRYAG